MVTTTLQGGLGNQLYMMAQLIAHSLRYNLDYCVPLKVLNPHYEGQKPYIYSGVKYCDADLNLPLYKEESFVYKEIPFIDNVCFSGYWQSFRYLDDYREEILKAFGFKWQSEKGVCAVHNRLGDYLRLPDYHPFVGAKYLVDSLDEMNKRTGITRFRIFSNDITWCREFFKVINEYTFEFVEGNTELEDLEQGSYCEHSIGSNGTFALWMYWLNQNPNKIGIFPKRWFGKSLNHDTSDLYPINSIKL